MILYLDFDGVLHPDAVYRPHNRPLELRSEGSLFMHAAVLEDILGAYPDLRIILSTSWVRMLGYDRTLKKMPVGLRHRVAGSTWHREMRRGGSQDPFDWLTRYQQISRHVEHHAIRH